MGLNIIESNLSLWHHSNKGHMKADHSVNCCPDRSRQELGVVPLQGPTFRWNGAV
jgi:hypothetical protein